MPERKRGKRDLPWIETFLIISTYLLLRGEIVGIGLTDRDDNGENSTLTVPNVSGALVENEWIIGEGMKSSAEGMGDVSIEFGSSVGEVQSGGEEGDIPNRFPLKDTAGQAYAEGSTADRNHQEFDGRRDLGPEELDEEGEASQLERDYSRWLKLIVLDPPDISANGDPERKGLGFGLGYVTLYGSEELGIENLVYRGSLVWNLMSNEGLNVEELSEEKRRLYEYSRAAFDSEGNQILMGEELYQKIFEKLIAESQEGMTEEEALNSGKIVGFVATRSPEDIGKRFLVYAVDESPGEDGLSAEPRFVGLVLAVDTAAGHDWIGTQESTRVGNGLGFSTYSLKGWEDLPWIADMTSSLMRQMPAGTSGDPENVNQGRPGVLLVSEAEYLGQMGIAEYSSICVDK